MRCCRGSCLGDVGDWMLAGHGAVEMIEQTESCVNCKSLQHLQLMNTLMAELRISYCVAKFLQPKNLANCCQNGGLEIIANKIHEGGSLILKLQEFYQSSRS